jgi:predicted dehydrogenase
MIDESAGRPLGYGIIGCGWVADDHARGVAALGAEDVRLVAVADADPAQADRFALPGQGVAVHRDYLDLLDREDVDVVSVCLPDHLHAEVAIAAAERGKHVLCEKPLAIDVAGADRMLAACRRNQVELGVVFNHRYAPDNIRARSAIADGAIGDVVVGDVLHSSALSGDPTKASPWRGRAGMSAGGVLSTQAIHFLDLLLWFCGPVAAAQAYTARAGGADHEHTVALSLKLRSGALATLVSTNLAPITDDFTGTRVEVHGTQGYLTLEGDELRSAVLAPGRVLGRVRLPDLGGDAEAATFGGGHIHEVIDFVRAVRRGDPAPIPGTDGRHLMAVLMAAYRSAADGGSVPVEEPTDAYRRSAPGPAALLATDPVVPH